MAALVSCLIGSMNQLAPTYVGLGDAWLRLKRIEQELANSPPLFEPNDAPLPQTIHGAFALDGVTVRYEDKSALCEVSLNIRAGAITAIIGPSGAGKTTLTLALLRLIEPQHGHITIDGAPIQLYPRQALWRHVGYVPQEPILFRGSVRENIMAGRSLAESEMIAAGIEAGIHDRLSAMTNGYDVDVGENGYRLSAGERQRISFARALASRPSVLVLDEPTANLDAATNAWIRNTIIDQRGAGRTVIIITHSPATVAIADDVIVLDKGVLVCSGSMADPTIEAQVAQIMPDYTCRERPNTSSRAIRSVPEERTGSVKW
jgi:ABC-type multidrug transport system fused ATPase/permease subunit